MSRVALFVDGANMFYAQRQNEWHIDFRLVHQYFMDNREKAGAYYFTASPPAGDLAKIDTVPKIPNRANQSRLQRDRQRSQSYDRPHNWPDQG